MPYNKRDRETAPFRDTPDSVQFGLLYDIAELERNIVSLTESEAELLDRLRGVRKTRDNTADRMYALESAVDAYDRAKYEMKHDLHWPQQRYQRRRNETW
jgi:predicted  nucleic acid-binding Zn-ribbon protein